jgi:Raf kinase inhibitor-like YbhB/YbcL family protein
MKIGSLGVIISVTIIIALSCTVVFAASNSGSLAVTSKPVNASVTIDSRFAGFTPLTISDLPTGKHSLIVSLDGYLPFRKDVTVSQNKTVQVSVSLVKATPAKTPVATVSRTPTKTQVPQTPVKTPALTKKPTPILTPTKKPVTTTPSPNAKMTLGSSAFSPGGAIPEQYGCRGFGSVIPVSWSNIPAKTVSMALIIEDPDAPSGTFTHWIIYNIPPSVTGINGPLIPGASTGVNSAGIPGYYPPCPPSGSVHHYVIHLYALDTTITGTGLDNNGIAAAMNGHILATAQIQGSY